MLLNEGLKENDLEFLVSNGVSIDEYTSKIDTDNITVAFFVSEYDAVCDLKDFIEKTEFTEIQDIEISSTLTQDNKYIIFVEFERNIVFPDVFMDFIENLTFITNIDNWIFKSLDMDDSKPLTKENIKKYIRLNKLRDVIEKDEEKVNESYIGKKFEIISKSKFDKMLDESSKINDNKALLEKYSKKFPNYKILTIDENLVIINKNGQILKEI